MRSLWTAVAVALLLAPSGALAAAPRRAPAAPPPPAYVPPPASAAAPVLKKTVVSVENIEDQANTGKASTLRTMIETAVSNSGKFRLMETSAHGVSVLLKEQADAKAGLRTSNTPGKMGGFEGIDYKIYGTITTGGSGSTRNATASTGMQMAGLGIAKLGGGSFFGNAAGALMVANSDCRNSQANISVDIKIVDAATSEVRYTKHVTQTERTGVACGSGNPQIDVEALLRTAAQRAARGLVSISYPIKVLTQQDDGQAILNYGEGILFPGDVLAVFSQGKEIIDIDTGAKLGASESFLGLVQVSEVLPKMSKAQLLTTFATAPPSGAVAREPSDQQMALLQKTGNRRK